MKKVSGYRMKLTMTDIIRKLTSRKLWAAIASVVTGIALISGADGNEIMISAGAFASAFGPIVYLIAEACVDAANKGKLPEATEKSVDE